MSAITRFILFAVVLSVRCCSRCFSQECVVDKNHYLSVTNPLVVPFESLRTPSALAEQSRVTTQAFEAIDDDVLRLLSKASSVTPDAVSRYVSCVQDSAIYNGWRATGKVPEAFDLTPVPGIALAYIVYRGPEIAMIPETLPALDFFVKGSTGWQAIHHVLYAFEASTLDVREIDSGKQGEVWFLVSGFPIGDTGTRLRLMIVGFNGEDVRTVWETSGLAYTTLASASGKDVELVQYRDSPGGKDLHLVWHWRVDGAGLTRDREPRDK